MLEIRNLEGRLVCLVDERTGTVEIVIKDCVTLIKHTSDGGIKVINSRRKQKSAA
jgi:hypothetical protein